MFTDVVHLHSARTAGDVIFGAQLRELDRRNPGYRLHLQLTGERGRMSPADLDRLCPTGASERPSSQGPPRCWRRSPALERALGDTDRLHVEHFQPYLGEEEGQGDGGPIHFCASDVRGESDGSKPILVGR